MDEQIVAEMLGVDACDVRRAVVNEKAGEYPDDGRADDWREFSAYFEERNWSLPSWADDENNFYD